MDSVFDTLQYAKRAIDKGFSPEQAEFQAQELATLLKDSIVTKRCLKEELFDLEYRLRGFQYRIVAAILGGITTIMTISQMLLHFLGT